MTIAIHIYEGNQSVEGLSTNDREVELYKVVGDPGEFHHDIQLARAALPVELGAKWKPTQNTGLILHERRLVEWVGPDAAIIALVYAPPGRFGSLQNSSTFSRSDPFPIELPVWSEKPYAVPGGEQENYQLATPVTINRGRSVRAEYRIRPNSDKEAVIFGSGAFNGHIFLIGATVGISGQYYQFTGASTQETSRGTISVAYWFARMGTVKAIEGFKIGSVVDLPFLGPFSSYQTDLTGSVPVVSPTDRSLFEFTSTELLPGL